MPSKTRNANSQIIPLLLQLAKVADEEKKLAKQRTGIEKKIDAIRAKCPHKERKQVKGTFAFFCTACGKRM